MEGHCHHNLKAIMFRAFVFLIVLSSCSMGTIKSGGDRPYGYDINADYSSAELTEMAPQMVTSFKREPQVEKLDRLFGEGQSPLKRVGILIFETRIQPTYDGLSGKNQIYLSPSGKQILTENLLRVWQESAGILAGDIDMVPSSQIIKSTGYQKYGLRGDDFVNSLRSSLAPDDIFFTESGKKTTTSTVLNPRGHRDLSFMLVPAYELMGGPKWSEHNKQFVNDVAKELNLDAVIIMMSDLKWTAAHTDKHSGETVPEEITVKIQSSTLVPLSRYHERLEKLINNEKPNVTLCFRSYESEVKVPALISVPEEIKNFETIEKELLYPMLKTYKDLSQMTLIRISHDLRSTWK